MPPLSAGRLQDVHALVTRPRERAEELCFLLEDEGARVTALPLLELAPPEDPRPLQAAAERLARFDWVAFASPSAVAALVDAARQGGTFDLHPGRIAPALAHHRRARHPEHLLVGTEQRRSEPAGRGPQTEPSAHLMTAAGKHVRRDALQFEPHGHERLSRGRRSGRHGRATLGRRAPQREPTPQARGLGVIGRPRWAPPCS